MSFTNVVLLIVAFIGGFAVRGYLDNLLIKTAIRIFFSDIGKKKILLYVKNIVDKYDNERNDRDAK